MKHLRFDCISAYNEGRNEHPQKILESLGITYQHATPQSIADQWWFWNCENIPDPLPTFLEELNVKPSDAIGFGLNQETADKIESKK